MKKSLVVLAALTLTVLFTCSALAGHHGKKADKRIGILLVAFGSSEPSARISFETIARKTGEAHPGTPVFWAYTSHIIRKKLAEQGTLLDSPEVALARMADQGFTHVVVQSLHTIAGAEYHDLIKVVSAFRIMGSFEDIQIGDPLLATQEDMARVVDAIIATVPEKRSRNEAVVLMGHGSHHPANAFYAALMFQVQLRDPNIFIGTVEGYPEINDIRRWLEAKAFRTVWLMPFMSVAGDHAKNDMAGDEDDSWKSILTKAGFDCRTVLKGTAEYDAFVSIWVDHLGKPLGNF